VRLPRQPGKWLRLLHSTYWRSGVVVKSTHSLSRIFLERPIRTGPFLFPLQCFDKEGSSQTFDVMPLES
jgi:hypothetical protein